MPMVIFFQSLRLRIKFFLSMMVLILGIIGGMLYIIFVREKQTIIAELQRRAIDLTAMLAYVSAPEVAAQHYIALQNAIDGIKNRPDLRLVMILDRTGKILAHNNVTECDKVYSDSLTQLILMSSSSLALPIYRRNDERVLDVATPVYLGAKQKVGFARAVISVAGADEAINVLVWRILLLGFAGFGVAFILAAIFSRVVTQPLQRLDQQALQISRGERDIQIEVTSQDEIGHLQQALKTMVEDVRLQSRLSALGATTANLAHEIRTPLISITRHIHELISQSAAPEAGNRLLGEINQLNDLVKQLLQFSQKNKLALGRADVNELIKETLFLLAEPLETQSIKVYPDFQPLPLIAVDKNLMQSVFRNLIMNAMQAMSAAGELQIETRVLPVLPGTAAAPRTKLAPSADPLAAPEKPAASRWPQVFRKLRNSVLVEPATRAHRALLAKLPPEKQAIMITFRDNGCGISKALLEQLFLPFVTTKKDGNGLGLALSHKIVQEHHGAITVESQEGFGTTFSIFLPV